jgi:hypothetical protein
MGSLMCDWCEERFEPFLDDALTTGERARLLAHVDGCDPCRGLLEELRVVDALLLEPRTVELPENFTCATMADVRAMPVPCARRAPIAALLAAYIAGAWSLVGAAFLIVPQHMTAFVQHTFAVTSTVLAALGGIGHVFSHFGDRGDVSSWTTVAGGVIIADALAVVGVVAALRFARPRSAERLRW